MLAVDLGESKYSSSEFALKDNWGNPTQEVNHLVYNLFQGEREGFSLASPDEEAFDHFFVEQHVVGTLDDDDMHLSSKGFENCSSADGTPYSTRCYERGDYYGFLDTDPEQVGKQALKYEFMLQDTEVNENIHATCNLSCDCSDFLLESGSAGTLLMDYPSNNEATAINMKSSGQIQCMESSSDESRDSPNVSVDDQKWLRHGLLFDRQNLTGLSDVSNLMESSLLSTLNEDDMILIPGNEISESVFTSLPSISPCGDLLANIVKDEVPFGDVQTTLIKVSQGTHEISEGTNDSFITTKRLRKPTRRYIEEMSEITSRCSYERLKISFIASKAKPLRARTEEKFCWGDAMEPFNQDYPSRMQSLIARRRKITKRLGSDGKGYVWSPKTTVKSFYGSELPDDASDEPATTQYCQRRKHHRQWTLSEVVKLVDGVCQFGVGRWTEIKRLWFSASAYRTAVDLKDKWRNLLRASVAADSEDRNLVEAQRQKHVSAYYVPESILQRVRELSIVHPYPRNQKLGLRDLPTARPPSSGRRRRDSDAPAGLRSRILRRRSFSQ